MESEKFDFCIIDSPFIEEEHILFITKTGKPYLDRTVINDNSYGKIVKRIEKLGYVESDILTFELPVNYTKEKKDKKELKDMLLKIGLTYNKKLENNIYKDFELLMKQSTESTGDPITFKGLFNYSSYKDVSHKPENKIPEIGEKIKLSFYLFLECKFITKKECLVSFGGNFISTVNLPTKNYFQKVESEFIRIENPNNRNKIIFKSSKTNEDFLKELDYLKNGGFQYIDIDSISNEKPSNFETKTYVYNITEIMHNLNKKGRVIIEVENNLHFDEMIYFSNKIKKEKVEEKKKKIVIKGRKKESKELLKILEKKMEYFSSVEEYEKASQIKKDLEFVKKKDEMLSKIRREEMPIMEYRKKFHL